MSGLQPAEHDACDGQHGSHRESLGRGDGQRAVYPRGECGRMKLMMRVMIVTLLLMMICDDNDVVVIVVVIIVIVVIFIMSVLLLLLFIPPDSSFLGVLCVVLFERATRRKLSASPLVRMASGC